MENFAIAYIVYIPLKHVKKLAFLLDASAKMQVFLCQNKLKTKRYFVNFLQGYPLKIWIFSQNLLQCIYMLNNLHKIAMSAKNGLSLMMALLK